MVQSCRNDICLHSVCLYPNLILNKCSTIILSQIGLDFKNDNIFSNGMVFGPTMPANYDEQTSIANVSKIDCNIKRLNMQKYLLQYRLYVLSLSKIAIANEKQLEGWNPLPPFYHPHTPYAHPNFEEQIKTQS